MTVQDDAREQELCNLFNLAWDPQHARGGTDAVLDVDLGDRLERIEFEVKSSTKGSVSTARDVGMPHIGRWRTKHWVFGFYSEGVGIRARLDYALYLTPSDMAPWLDDLEAYIRPDVLLAQSVPDRLTEDDPIRICGAQDFYSMEDAKRIFKKQWTQADYEGQLDRPPSAPSHYSRARMLEILKRRAGCTMERGATLNNPHITKTFLDGFAQERMERDFAQRLREKLRAYLAADGRSRTL